MAPSPSITAGTAASRTGPSPTLDPPALVALSAVTTATIATGQTPMLSAATQMTLTLVVDNGPVASRAARRAAQYAWRWDQQIDIWPALMTNTQADVDLSDADLPDHVTIEELLKRSYQHDR